MGFKKPEGTDTFYAFVQDICANIDNLENCLDDKSDILHNHDESYNTKAEVAALLAGKSSADHTHSDVYTKEEADALLENKSDVSHTHDSRYYTETEIDRKFSELTATGTWNPRIYGSDTYGSPTYTSYGNYIKIGNLVYINGYVNVTSKGGMAGALNIDRLPFKSGAFASERQRFLISARGGYGTLASGYVMAECVLAAGASSMGLTVGSTASTAYDLTAAMLNDGAQIWVSGCYITE